MNKPFTPKQTCRFLFYFMLYFPPSSSTLTWSMSRLTVHSYLPYRPFRLSNPIKQQKKTLLCHSSHLCPVCHDLDLFRGHLVRTCQTTYPHPSCWICRYSLSDLFQKEKPDER